jgi:hypothetical protein
MINGLDQFREMCLTHFRLLSRNQTKPVTNWANLLGIVQKLHLCFWNEVSSSTRPIEIMEHVIIFIEGDDQWVGPEPEETIFHRSDYKIRPLEEPACSPDAA